MQVLAHLTEIRSDGMQKWENPTFGIKDSRRYIWLSPRMSKPGLAVGATGTLEFTKGTAGLVGGHWAGWKLVK